MTTFDSTKESLLDLLQSIKQAKTQLPDFQRGWVWDDDHIRSLLASVSLSFPIGAVMMLQTGNPDVRFKPRLVEGLTLANPPEPERLILDGQQRLTSLFLALLSGAPVDTRDRRDKPIKRWYYLDIAQALSPNGDREDAIVAISEDKQIRNFRNEVIADYSTTEKECAAELLPLPLVFDTAGLTNWQMKYLQLDPSHIQERLSRWNQLVSTVIQRFQQYQIPLILMRKQTLKEAVCQVFEKVNTGGVSLTVFELLTATYAAEEYNLREDWDTRLKRLKKHKILEGIESTDFLQGVTLLATRARRVQSLTQGIALENAPGISCKRREILRLTLDDYKTWAHPVTQGFEKASKLLFSLKIFSSRDLPYRTQVTPLAAILAVLGERADTDGVRARLARWYWCGVFGELYGSAVETQFAKDLPEFLAWLEGGPEPSAIAEANFAPERLLTLKTRNSAAYKGLYALLLNEGGLDFRSGETIDQQSYFDDKIDIHHIFPQHWCRNNGIEPKRCDCIVNKTPLAAKTNRMIGASSPSVYLGRIQKNAVIIPTRMDEILESHLIAPAFLRTDDFLAFFKARERALLDRVETVMGKPIARDLVQSHIDDLGDYEEEEQSDEEVLA
jgi:hypothetical protein